MIYSIINATAPSLCDYIKEYRSVGLDKGELNLYNLYIAHYRFRCREEILNVQEENYCFGDSLVFSD